MPLLGTDEEWEQAFFPTDEQLTALFTKHRNEMLTSFKTNKEKEIADHLGKNAPSYYKLNTYKYISPEDVIEGNTFFSKPANLYKLWIVGLLEEAEQGAKNGEDTPHFINKGKSILTEMLLHPRIYIPSNGAPLLPVEEEQAHFFVYEALPKHAAIIRLKKESWSLFENRLNKPFNCLKAEEWFQDYLSYRKNGKTLIAKYALYRSKANWLYCSKRGSFENAESAESMEKLFDNQAKFLIAVSDYVTYAEMYFRDPLIGAALASMTTLKKLIAAEKYLQNTKSIPNYNLKAYLDTDSGGKMVDSILEGALPNAADYPAFKEALLAGLTPSYFLELGEASDETFKEKLEKLHISSIDLQTGAYIGKAVKFAISLLEYLSPSYYLSGEAFETAEDKAERFAASFLKERIRQVARDILDFQKALVAFPLSEYMTPVYGQGWVPILYGDACDFENEWSLALSSEICMSIDFAFSQFSASAGTTRGISIPDEIINDELAGKLNPKGGFDARAPIRSAMMRKYNQLQKMQEIQEDSLLALVDLMVDYVIPAGLIAKGMGKVATVFRKLKSGSSVQGKLRKLPVVNKANPTPTPSIKKPYVRPSAGRGVPTSGKRNSTLRDKHNNARNRQKATGGANKATSASDEVAESADLGKPKKKPDAWTEGKAYGNSNQGMAAVIKKLKEEDMTPEELGKFFKDKKNQKLFNSLFKDAESRKIARSIKNEDLGKMIKKETTPFMKSSVASGMADEVNYVSLTLEKVATKGGSKIICKSHIEINLNKILPDGVQLTGGLGQKARTFKLKEGLRADELKKAIDSAEQGKSGTWKISYGDGEPKIIQQAEYARLKEMAEGKTPIYIELGKNPEHALETVRDDIAKIISESIEAKSGGLNYEIIGRDIRLGKHEQSAQTTYQFFDIEKTRHYHFEYEVRYRVDGVEYHSIYNVEIPISIKDSKLPKANIGKQRFSLFENDAYNELLISSYFIKGYDINGLYQNPLSCNNGRGFYFA